MHQALPLVAVEFHQELAVGLAGEDALEAAGGQFVGQAFERALDRDAAEDVDPAGAGADDYVVGKGGLTRAPVPGIEELERDAAVLLYELYGHNETFWLYDT